MKNYTLGVFTSPDQAEAAVNKIHTDLGVPSDNISYLYKDAHGNMKEVDTASGHSTPAAGATKGATIGAVIGAGLGLATVAGLLPVIGPIFAAGPIIAALGLGAGAVGTTAAGALTGVAAGGLVGALVSLGIGESEAKVYQDKVSQGNILVAVHADEAINISRVLSDQGAMDVNSYRITL